MASTHILVIGSRGTVGSAVAAAAGSRAVSASRGPVASDMIAFDALVHDVSSLFVHLANPPKASVIAFGVSGTHTCASDPAGSRHLNVDRVLTLAAGLAKAGSLPVVLSSDSVFDGTPTLWSEQDEPNPICEYGRQRFALERGIARLGIPYLLIRLSRVVADHTNRRDLLFQWCNRLRQGATIELPTDQLFTPIAARDLGRIVVQLIDAGALGLINVAGPEQVSAPDLFERLQSSCARRGLDVRSEILSCRVADLPGIELRPAATMLSIGRLQKIIAPRFTPLNATVDSVVAASFPAGTLGSGNDLIVSARA